MQPVIDLESYSAIWWCEIRAGERFLKAQRSPWCSGVHGSYWAIWGNCDNIHIPPSWIRSATSAGAWFVLTDAFHTCSSTTAEEYNQLGKCANVLSIWNPVARTGHLLRRVHFVIWYLFPPSQQCEPVQQDIVHFQNYYCTHKFQCVSFKLSVTSVISYQITITKMFFFFFFSSFSEPDRRKSLWTLEASQPVPVCSDKWAGLEKQARLMWLNDDANSEPSDMKLPKKTLGNTVWFLLLHYITLVCIKQLNSLFMRLLWMCHWRRESRDRN